MTVMVGANGSLAGRAGKTDSLRLLEGAGTDDKLR